MYARIIYIYTFIWRYIYMYIYIIIHIHRLYDYGGSFPSGRLPSSSAGHDSTKRDERQIATVAWKKTQDERWGVWVIGLCGIAYLYR